MTVRQFRFFDNGRGNSGNLLRLSLFGWDLVRQQGVGMEQGTHKGRPYETA
jgi:hypothetical protein